MTTGQRAIKQAVEASTIGADRITCRADGTVEVRRAYNHWRERDDNTADLWGDQVMAVVPSGAKLEGAWPEARFGGTSYYVAVLR